MTTNQCTTPPNKSFHVISVDDKNGKRYDFVRSENRIKKGFYDVAKCEPLHDGHIDDSDGVIINARWYSDKQVADLIAESHEYQERLTRAEAALKEWIEVSEKWKKIPKHKRSLQKKEEVLK